MVNVLRILLGLYILQGLVKFAGFFLVPYDRRISRIAAAYPQPGPRHHGFDDFVLDVGVPRVTPQIRSLLRPGYVCVGRVSPRFEQIPAGLALRCEKAMEDYSVTVTLTASGEIT